MTPRTLIVLGLTLLLAGLPAPARAESEREWGGFVAAELRAFDGDTQFSLVAEPEFEWRGPNDRNRFAVKLFARGDSLDDERTHADVRELYWERNGRSWELRAGISKVFWGVTESQHLVDVINQTDLVENPDGEDKLGQPMIKFTTIRNWGIVDVFLLPGFRERTFAGLDGRLRGPRVVDTDLTTYESSAGDEHLDIAARWSHTFGLFDLGVAGFKGTNREPRLLPSGAVLAPFYDQMEQVGVDLQATVGDWLWKLESIRRTDSVETFVAATAGLEYTFWGVRDSSIDVGLLVEYLWDERGDRAATPFDDDWFVGSRLAFNDTADSTVLAGMIFEPESGARSGLVEARRRFGAHWIVEAELRTFHGGSRFDPIAAVARDDHVLLSVQRHF